MRNNFYLGTLRTQKYNDKFRREVANYAIEAGSMSKAAKAYDVAVGSVWRWLHAFGLMQDYRAMRQTAFSADPFVRHDYQTQFRRTVAEYAMSTSFKDAAKHYGVSVGSADNWVKAWQGNNFYLNRTAN